MAEKNTKQKQVLEHLQRIGHITSWEAIMLYKATRLSAIIYCLRDKGYDISTETIVDKDVNGNAMQFALYRYKGIVNE